MLSRYAPSRDAASSPRSRVRRRSAAVVAGVAASIALTAPASAAVRLETFDLPSTKGNVVLKPKMLNRTDALRANVYLPDGYDEQPDTRWPVLYLLHGLRDNKSTWSENGGDIPALLKKTPAIVVMPEGGTGYYVDHFNGGKRKGENWSQYNLEEVIPTIEAKYRVKPGRANHSIGGLSMGGYGAALYAAQLPSYFGSFASLSGLLTLRDPLSEWAVPEFADYSYTAYWGPRRGDYVRANDPLALLDNLKRTRVYLYTGNGLASGEFPWNNDERTYGAVGELASRAAAHRFHGDAKAAGIDVTLKSRNGVHNWPYWKRETPYMFAWGPFKPTTGDDPATRLNFTYRTMQPHGNAWGLGFRFDGLPSRLLTLKRTGQTLTASGAGTLTINPGAADADASGAGTKPECSFTAKLPFERTLPAGC